MMRGRDFAGPLPVVALFGHAELTQASPLLGDEQTWLYRGPGVRARPATGIRRGIPVKSVGPLASLSNKQCDSLSVAEVLKGDIQ